jgi:uncharacterized membrane protein YqjE
MAVPHEPNPRLREQSMGELFKELSNDLSTLVRQELKLAQVEMTMKGRRAVPAAGMLSGAGVLALASLATLSACLIAALAEGMDVWLAALIVTVIYGIGATALAIRGKHRAAEAAPPVPEQTIETVKEDVQWAKTQLSSDSR